VKVGDEVEIVGTSRPEDDGHGRELVRSCSSEGRAGGHIGVFCAAPRKEDVEPRQVWRSRAPLRRIRRFQSEVYILSKMKAGA